MSNTINICTERIKMQILIKNAAKILNAELVVDGITTIAGHNNMGKSTILKSIYVALNTFRNSTDKIIASRKQSIRSYLFNSEDYFDSNGCESMPRDLLFTFYREITNHIEEFNTIDKDNYELFKKLFFKSLARYEEFLPNDLEKCTIFQDSFIEPLYNRINSICSSYRVVYLISIGEMYIRNVFKGQLNNLYGESQASIRVESRNENYFMSISDNKIVDIEYSRNSEPDVYYIPAYNTLDVITSFRPRLSQFSPEEAIRQALSSDNNDPSLEQYQEAENNTKLIREILEDVIHGKLEESSAGELAFKDYNSDKFIKIGNVASGVKNFLIIQTLIEKGKLKRNSLLLIDEPETNLHPEWHIKFADLLVLMYKRMGIRSIVNSHSPYFIRSLEVKMADHGIKKHGRYYMMEEKQKDLFIPIDVTMETDRIYKTLYEPLEYL